MAESWMSQDVYAYGVTREEEGRNVRRASVPTNNPDASEGYRRRSIARQAKELANCTFASRYGLVA